MALVYSTSVINARLNAIVTELGANATMVLLAGAITVSTIQLSNPAGTVNNGVLTFTGQLLDPAATATGDVNGAVIKDSGGLVAISGLTVGIPGGSQNVIISNGLNSTVITVGQTVALISAQITGS